jgi:hypothetical protein
MHSSSHLNRAPLVRCCQIQEWRAVRAANPPTKDVIVATAVASLIETGHLIFGCGLDRLRTVN